ncbi:uncharacterized protein FSUBG_8081 [Fusarium subglutinans]|uniref:Uncharacterized protein n=1 Tax=Gibberella subglutinans TaxID=42677 RepID=A0A8H5UY53_GIBSU|nr:uncharacterized protein FSUBG_8081 [Fusarium subglutinans]KAF5601715.1 hypothetical protein FSUBG_8081 [Fusarium subglutinans]
MMPAEAYSSSSENSADSILQAVLARKKKQNVKKAQPWKETYAPQVEDLPTTTSPHDKPWLDGKSGGEDDPNDTDAGKT